MKWYGMGSAALAIREPWALEICEDPQFFGRYRGGGGVGKGGSSKACRRQKKLLWNRNKNRQKHCFRDILSSSLEKHICNSLVFLYISVSFAGSMCVYNVCMCVCVCVCVCV